MQQTLAGGSHWVSAFPGPQKRATGGTQFMGVAGSTSYCLLTSM